MTSRELVFDTLNFKHSGRIPRELWSLPWARDTYPEVMDHLEVEYPSDIVTCPKFLRITPKTVGDQYRVGTYIDEWGCIFEQRENGFVGEVKTAISTAEDYTDFIDSVHVPEEWLSVDGDKVNKYCRNTDKFVLAGALPRIFERMQFIRGTEQFYIDLMLLEPGMLEAIDLLHQFYLKQLEIWAQTEVDALMIMDDWGSQISLLINPKLWREIFKPLYVEYAAVARKYGKKLFMHSDGYIMDIIPDLIEIGIDAVNSQLFCMGLDALKEFAGKITFWGEIDRQNLLPSGSVQDIDAAVREVYSSLYCNGGCIAQCEFGPGARPENILQVFESWNRYNG